MGGNIGGFDFGSPYGRTQGGNQYQQQQISGLMGGLGACHQNVLGQQLNAFPNLKPIVQEKKSMFKEVKEDLKKFTREHKSMIYWIVGLVILDRIYFKGAFEKKLAELAHRFVALLETKLDKIAPGVPSEKRDA